MKRHVASATAILFFVVLTSLLPGAALARKVMGVPQDQKPLPLSPGVRGPVGDSTTPLSPPHFPEISPRIWHSVWLNVPLYSQNDPRWEDFIMQTCGRTIGQAGCALTSSAMVFKF